jgi:hypothetical protein
MEGAPVWTKRLLLGLVVILSGCVRPHRQPVQAEDLSVHFPDFDAPSVITVGADGKAYELEGVTLRALLIAANDFLPPAGENTPCKDRPEAHRYRVVRQGDIVFVQIEDDDVFCGLKYLSLDTGARYAISTEGRILRRSFGAEPDLAPDSSSGVPSRGADAESRDGGTVPPGSADSGVP